MFFRKRAEMNKKIKVTRDSVCMGDDCNAPNEVIIMVSNRDDLSEVFYKVSQTLPKMKEVIWPIDTGIKVLGYIIFDEKGKITFDYCVPYKEVVISQLVRLHCSYFHCRSFTYQKDGQEVEKYPQYKTLLEKVKQAIGERFVDELKIEGGCISIWGEYFGRPYDNYHSITSLRWSHEEIAILFSNDQSLYIKNPIVKQNEKDIFVVEDASEVLWVWNEKNIRYVRLYIKKDNVILRAEGKRSEIRNESCMPFEPKNNVAVVIERNGLKREIK